MSRETGFEMESEISTRKVIQELEGITLAKNTAARKRKVSLFEAKERLKGRDEDKGIAVMTHADYPLRSRSRSLPVDPEKARLQCGFVRDKVTKVIQEVLETKLKGKIYEAKECSVLTKQLVSIIRDRVSTLDLKKYKLVCTCVVTKKLKPAPSLQSGCAWDESVAAIDEDGFAEYVYKSDELIAVASVYGIHAEKGLEREKMNKAIKGFIHAPIPE